MQGYDIYHLINKSMYETIALSYNQSGFELKIFHAFYSQNKYFRNPGHHPEQLNLVPTDMLKILNKGKNIFKLKN